MQVETEQRPSTGSRTKRTVTNHAASALASSAHIPDGLDWQAFSAAYFPERRRHDLGALAAYGAYRRSHSDAALSCNRPVRIETGRGATGAPALRNWEDEGGATLSPDAP